MRLHHLLAATLAGSMAVGYIDTSPFPRASAAPPQPEKAAKPSHEIALAPPPQDAPPPTTATGSPTTPDAKDTDKPPPDPYAGVRGVWESYPEQIEKILTPFVEAALRRAFEPKLHDHEKMAASLIRLGTYRLPPLRPEAEKSLRTLTANARQTEIFARGYLASTDLLLGGRGRLLAAAYEHLNDQGTEIPTETRRQLAELLEWEEPEQAFVRGPEDLAGVITERAARVRTKLLKEDVWGHNIFGLAVPIADLGRSVIEKRRLTKVFHDLVMTLPEPQRTDILMQLFWSCDGR